MKTLLLIPLLCTTAFGQWREVTVTNTTSFMVWSNPPNSWQFITNVDPDTRKLTTNENKNYVPPPITIHWYWDNWRNEKKTNPWIAWGPNTRKTNQIEVGHRSDGVMVWRILPEALTNK